MTHAQRAAEIVPEWNTYRDSLPAGEACDCGKWRLCKHDDDQRIYKVRAAVATALADVERATIEKCIEATCNGIHRTSDSAIACDKITAAIRAAFAADERGA